jgi:hypothetical protein
VAVQIYRKKAAFILLAAGAPIYLELDQAPRFYWTYNCAPPLLKTGLNLGEFIMVLPGVKGRMNRNLTDGAGAEFQDAP